MGKSVFMDFYRWTEKDLMFIDECRANETTPKNLKITQQPRGLYDKMTALEEQLMDLARYTNGHFGLSFYAGLSLGCLTHPIILSRATKYKYSISPKNWDL